MKQYFSCILTFLLFMLLFFMSNNLYSIENVESSVLPKLILSQNVSGEVYNTVFTDQIYHLCQSNTLDSVQIRPIKPPLSGGRIATELAVGTGAGIVVGYGIAFTAILIASNTTSNVEDHLWDILRAGGLGLILGTTAGATTGVYIVGCYGDQSGSLGMTILGALGGMALVLSAFYMMSSSSNEAITPFFASAVGAASVVIPAVGAAFAFNLTRKYETQQVGQGIINLQDGKLSLNFPMISFCRNDQDFSPKVKLINFAF